MQINKALKAVLVGSIAITLTRAGAANAFPTIYSENPNNATTSSETDKPSKSPTGCGQPPKFDVDVDSKVQVLVRVIVNPSGSVTRARIIRSSGRRHLDQKALQYVRKCRFEQSSNGREGNIMLRFYPK